MNITHELSTSSPSQNHIFVEMGISWYTKPLKNFIISNLMRPTHTHSTSNVEDDDHDQFHPSPSLVLLPLQFLSTINRDDRLPVVQYAMLKQRSRAQNDEEEEGDGCRCAVCLSGIEAWHNVRELGNCGHAFHVECLDSWMNHGHATCPVCRAKLVSGHGKDPWRSERMLYLFGQDCAMDDLRSC